MVKDFTMAANLNIDLSGKVAFISASAAGIGKVIAEGCVADKSNFSEEKCVTVNIDMCPFGLNFIKQGERNE